MEAVITGDIINSTQRAPTLWLPTLKSALGEWGSEPSDWELYRGDSFQLRLSNPLHLMDAAVWIKAAIRTHSGLDVRMGIGVGEISYRAERITESNGTAFIHSGEIFDQLGKMDQHIALQTPWPALDKEVNITLRLALIPMDRWTSTSALTVLEVLKHPGLTQTELGSKLGIAQNAVSTRLSRAHLDAILQWKDYFPTKLLPYL
jgi:hypothetical protein